MILMSLLAFLSILHHIVKIKLISINLTLDTFFGEGNGTPLQYPCLEHPMDRGAWWAAVHGVTQSDVTEMTQHKHPHEAKGMPL